MKEQNLLLQRNVPRLKQTHEGKSITLKSRTYFKNQHSDEYYLRASKQIT
ncbi:hypothetical protein LEP1GSC008_4537 [Leptospira kirschneri serovar Bulgarica str. Nikolaevo]|uniref:Uncharacterized protein n=1 Tax=Leptospira kirschneri serovar Bulgarica str. Nikolaevo TaxID=1240687 RepID=M6F8S7_9LEPT|nr:hypothetical protein LEP1GSC008_4537 [Leptospira kirschneri serovar Bulgarica str. Nikolaevo]